MRDANRKSGGYDLPGCPDTEGSGSDLRNAALNVGMGFGTAGVFGGAITDIANNTMMSNLMEPSGSTSTSLKAN